MRSIKREHRLHLETLEDRWVPATIRLIGGNLFISRLSGGTGLEVRATATPGQFEITDNGKLVTVNGVGRLISITGTNRPDLVTVNLNEGTFGGSILANLGNGNDTFEISGAGGTLGGNLTVLSGRGNDTVRLNRPGAEAGSLRIGGNTTLQDLRGDDTLEIGNDTDVTTLGGNLTVGNFNTVRMGDGQEDVYGRNVTIRTLDDLALDLNQGVFAGSEVSPIGGNFTITSGSADDAVILRGLIVGGNLIVNLGDAVATNEFTTNSSANSVTTVNGNLIYQGGANTDDIDIGGMVVDGDTTLYLGEGDNTVAMYNFGPNPGTLLAGDLNIFSGNGDLSANIGAQVAGNILLSLGNGANSVTFTSTNTLGGMLTVRAGNGGNTLTLEGAQTYLLDALFGSGDDTVEINNAALVLIGRLDGGTGTNTLIQTDGTLGEPLWLAGF